MNTHTHTGKLLVNYYINKLLKYLFDMYIDFPQQWNTDALSSCVCYVVMHTS